MTRSDIGETLKSVDAEAKIQAFHLSQCIRQVLPHTVVR